MSQFAALLDKFAKAVATNDGAGMAALFTAGGTYVDYFFGPYTGAKAIANMIRHFHDGGRDFQWQFHDPVCDGRTGYARYTFSYVSTLPEAKGRAVLFEGMGCFKIDDGKIAHYSEVFDRGAALVQLDFASERIKKSLGKWTGRMYASPEAKAHVARLKAAGAVLAA
jgi:limonene-1,2-epoxide hydrolase